MSFDPQKIRADFPILHQQVNGEPLVYLDNAATTQKPKTVIDALVHYYTHDNANVHRGVHALSVRATEAYEAARNAVARFIHAELPSECVFVRGTTEAINLVAESFVANIVAPKDEILVSQMEHHSNIVPWQRLCERTGAVLKVIPMTEAGEITLEAFQQCLSNKTRFVAITHASNALGTVNPIKKMIAAAHEVGAQVLLDGAQAVAHVPVNVQDLKCDFYAFSGHKLYGPTGIGVLWGRHGWLERMSPYQSGGEMIRSVSFEKTTYAEAPTKFEAGTPNISGAIGLHAAIDYFQALDLDAVMAYEQSLLVYATASLKTLGDFHILGEARVKVPVLSFVHPLIHAHDIGTILDNHGIAIRSGHHCAMPVMDFYHVPASNRISMSFYNTEQEIDRCMKALKEAKAVFL